MATWHRARRADVGLRAIGSGLVALAYLAIARLAMLPIHPHPINPLAYLLAASGFLCGSAGSAMLLLGTHLFDEIEVSARWKRSLSTQNLVDHRT